MGLVKPDNGAITYNGQDIYGLNSQKNRVHRYYSCARGRRVFPNLTVLENMKIGAYMRNDKDGIAADIRWIYDLFPA